RRSRAAMSPTVMGERIEERIGGRVVALPRAAEDARDRGEQDEDGELGGLGQLFEMERRVELGPQDMVQPLRGERENDAVIEHAGRVHDTDQRMFGRDRREEMAERALVGDIAGGERDLRSADLELAGQGVGARRTRSRSRYEQKIAYAVLCHQVTRYERT